MGSEQSAIALLLFRVGPVLCCAPANAVQTIIRPPKLTHPPGSNDARPGIFYHAEHVVSVNELRHRFGIDETAREQPGCLIITLQDEDFIAYWVDEIIEVINTPTQGWSEPSSHLLQDVFNKTLLLNEKIYLFADFCNFKNLPESGYLNEYIDKLASGMSAAEIMAEVIEEKPEVQTEAEATPSPAASSSSTSENVHTTLTEPADTGQDDAQENKTNDSENNQTTVQTATQPSANTEEHTDIETPPLEPAHLHPGQEDEKAVSAEARELETDINAAALHDITAPDPSSQTKPGPDVSTKDHESISTTTETVETSPESIAVDTNTLEPLKEETAQAPENSAFPWQNLAATVVLFMTIAGIGIYYSSSNTSSKQQTLNSQPAMPRQLATAQDTEMTTRKPLTDAQQNSPARVQTEKKYQAEIKPDDKGVTIVLHSPKNEPIFKVKKQVSTKQPGIQKKLTVHADKPKKRITPGTQEIIHIVVKGDTLWAIAKHYVNNPYKYSRLARLSKIKNPNQIYPGNRVRILRYNRNGE